MFNDTVEEMTAALTDAAQPVDADTVIGLVPSRPRLLALGEPTHGEDVLLDLRNDLFRQLVEQQGYRTIAIESDCLMGLLVDDYVTAGTGNLDSVMELGFSHGWGAFAGNRELVGWMRAYNDGRAAAERVRFAGFDGPLEITGAASPRPALTALHAFLSARVDADLLACPADTLDRLIGADDRWTEPAAMMEPSRSVGQSPEAIQLRLLADDLVALLDAQTPHLKAASSPDDWDRARLYGRTATGLLRYHWAMADASQSRLTRLCAQRDSMMAANLLALAERGPTLVHAHNGHLHGTRAPCGWGSSRCNGGAPARSSTPASGRGTHSWPRPSERSATTGCTPRPRTPSRGSCMRCRSGVAWSTPAGWPRRSPTPRPPPGSHPGTATPRWTRTTSPATTGSHSSRTANRCDLRDGRIACSTSGVRHISCNGTHFRNRQPGPGRAQN